MAVSWYVSEPLPTPDPGEADRFARADLVFYGVDHSGSSFEARVFLDNAEADSDTPKDDPSYIGSFYVFGHGGCFGDLGHCDIPTGAGDPFDRRLPHPLLPQTITIEITDLLRERLRSRAEGTSFSVSVVPVARGWASNREDGEENLLAFERLALVTYG